MQSTLNCHLCKRILPRSCWKRKGLILCNPPYGKRIGKEEDLIHTYYELGNFLKQKASGWQFWLLNGNPLLSRSLKMKSIKRFPINNGGIDCRWMNYPIY